MTAPAHDLDLLPREEKGQSCTCGLQWGCGVRGWGRDGLGRGAGKQFARDARARAKALQQTDMLSLALGIAAGVILE